MLRPGTVVGHYELTKRLGEGNFGEVWQAKRSDAVVSSFFAIKFPKRSEVDRRALKEEAANWLCASGHTNVVSFIEAFETDDPEATYSAEPAAQLFLLVSEYIAGGTLEDWLKQHGGQAPTAAQAVELMRGILAGLDQLHQNKVIHRDLKPANILLQGETLKLADFGLSRVVTTTSKRSSKPSGTPVYMAPEAFDGKRNSLTDIWSAGAIFYELVCGSLPFPQRDMTALVKAIVLDEPKPLPATVPEGLRAIIMRCLSKEPRQRYESVATLRAALKDWQQPAKHKPKRIPPRPLTPTPPEPEPDDQAQQGSRVKMMAALGVLALVVVLLGLLVSQSANQPGNQISDRPTQSPTPSPPQQVARIGNNFVEPLGNGVELKMVAVPGGSFLMGSPSNEEGRDDDEEPQQRVNISAFAMGKYEITQAQWKAVMGSFPTEPGFRGDDLPVERVSWEDADKFCKKLSQLVGKTYRLPSEAQWEYAARAGTTGAYAGELDAMAWYNKNSGGKTHPVGQKQPNAFGLYDMHGNVWEWCEDVWHKKYNGAPTNGSSWLSGGDSSNRVLRGGSWSINSRYCRSADRDLLAPGDRNYDFGFRVVVLSRIS